MTEAWHGLASNFAVAAVFFALWAFAQHWLEGQGRRVRNLALGLCMGLGAVASMLLSVELQPGVFIDLRSALIAIAGYFGGPVAAILAAGMAGLYRMLVDGDGMLAGLVFITFAAVVGSLGFVLRKGRPATLGGILALGAALAAVGPISMLVLPPPLAAQAISQLALPLSVLSFLSTVLAAQFIQWGSRLTHDRTLLHAALLQAPDFHYVKDRESRFIAVNQAVATFNGFPQTADMIGKTDFDIAEPGRARELYQREQEIMHTGQPQLDREETLIDSSGDERWFSTSMVPLRNADGEIMGLAGVTRDITQQRRMEAELMDSRNLLSYAVSEMSDGLAMFDRNARLVYCNERYQSLFPLTSDVRRPGAHIRDILRAVVDTGEQVNLGDPELWIKNVAASMAAKGEEQVNLFNGRWLHIRTRPTHDGASMVVVSDVTNIKRTEGELMTLTSQLRTLATTDALTGLMNRRAFDTALVEGIERSIQDRSPISLIMCDVDHFKAYNDEYGHPAGDECLRKVGNCLKAALLRSGDFGVRYGGEEFAALLPNTDEESALVVAERIRTSLFDLRIPHAKSEPGVVTISVGVATYPVSALHRNAAQLLARADEALYDAKLAGRNRTVDWRMLHEARRAGLGIVR
jgi:diguanylate cyclase (GGDEF)-like protein/PAS domain S-box-containing protein